MAYLAPGQSRRTAWAMTWAVECRRTSRPASESSVTMATSRPVGQRRLEVHLAAVDGGDDGRLGQAGPDGPGELGRRRALGQLPHRAVGKTNRDDACHRAPFPAQPADRSWSGRWFTRVLDPPHRIVPSDGSCLLWRPRGSGAHGERHLGRASNVPSCSRSTSGSDGWVVAARAASDRLGWSTTSTGSGPGSQPV